MRALPGGVAGILETTAAGGGVTPEEAAAELADAVEQYLDRDRSGRSIAALEDALRAYREAT